MVVTWLESAVLGHKGRGSPSWSCYAKQDPNLEKRPKRKSQQYGGDWSVGGHASRDEV